MTGGDFDDTPFMLACRRQPVPRTPVWLMRQAGRYMREYREIRARVPFLTLCKTPDLAAEVTVTAAEKLGTDAAILFADILLIVEPMGFALEFTKGEGPVIANPVHTGADLARVRDVEAGALGYVFEAVRKIRAALPARTALIGFAGAPFTVASYLCEGDTSKTFAHTKRLMREDAGAWHELLSRLARETARYLGGQIEAGAQAVQIFDSWAGCLTLDEYRAFVAPHTRALIAALPAGVPVIHFGTGTAHLLEAMRDAGGDVIGVDHRIGLADAWRRLGDAVGVMGNLDPEVLLRDRAAIRAEVARILGEAAGRPGHVFNLGHGILPETPVENAIALVEEVHEQSARRP